MEHYPRNERRAVRMRGPRGENRWGGLSHTERLEEIEWVGIDVERTAEGLLFVRVQAWDRQDSPIEVPGLSSAVQVSPPSMYPYDCPLPLWLGYSAVSQLTECFLREDADFTLG